MTLKKPEFVLDKNLRYVPKDHKTLQSYVDLLKKELEQTIDPSKRISLLGETGVYLRQLNHFEEAEKFLNEALELIKKASLLYPDIPFQQSFLPSLHEILDSFDNILCETVIMHLPRIHIAEALHNLKRILKVGGVLYLSWRVTENTDLRLADGRLYSAFESQFILSQFPKNSILHFEDKISASSGKRVCRLVFKKDQI